MRTVASPVPTGAPVLLRQAGATVCGLEGTSSVLCSSSSTCAVYLAPNQGKYFAGCNLAGSPIATECIDIDTPCSGSCSAPPPGVLECRGDFYCATRHWMSSTSSTDSYDKPYATSYFCRHGAFAQVTATYFPDKYQEWNLETTVAPGSFPEQTAPASSADLAVTTAGGPGANSSNTNGNGNSSTPSSEVSPPLPTGAIAGIAVAGAVGLFATVLLILFWRRRKRSTTTATVQLVETSRPIESQDQDRSLLTSAATPSATHVYPVEKEAVSLTAASAMQTPGYPHSSETHLVDGNTAAENADTVGGLPELDDMRRLRPGAYMGGHRGAPSVMTDMSETLTLGGDGEVDDIHAIGHGGR